MPEQDAVVTESRSSVKIGQNAKGEAQVEVKVYEGSDPSANEAAQKQAVALFQATVGAVGA